MHIISVTKAGTGRALIGTIAGLDSLEWNGGLERRSLRMRRLLVQFYNVSLLTQLTINFLSLAYFWFLVLYSCICPEGFTCMNFELCTGKSECVCVYKYVPIKN